MDYFFFKCKKFLPITVNFYSNTLGVILEAVTLPTTVLCNYCTYAVLT
jgi:hypothetical protein